MSLREWLAHPIRTGTAAATSVLAVFHAEFVVTLFTYGWAHLQQWFTMATLLVASHQAFPVSQQQASAIVAVLAVLLLLKLSLQALNRLRSKLNEDT